MIAVPPIALASLQDILGELTLGSFHLLIELSVEALRYQVISSTEIWGNRIQHPRDVPEWHTFVDHHLAPSSAPPELARRMFSVFGRVVEQESLLVETGDLVPDFERAMFDLMQDCEQTYGQMASCLPMGPLFELEAFYIALASSLPEHARLHSVLPDRGLPEFTDDIQMRWHQAENFQPHVARDFFYYALGIKAKGQNRYRYSRRAIDLAGPTSGIVEPQRDPWNHNLAITPDTTRFTLRIDSQVPGQDQAQVVHAADYRRISAGEPVQLHLSFQPGSDQPVISVVGAEQVDVYSSEQPPVLEHSQYSPPDLIRRSPQIVFLVDAGLNPNTYAKVMQIVGRIARHQIQLDPHTTAQLIAFGDRREHWMTEDSYELRSLYPVGDQLIYLSEFLLRWQQYSQIVPPVPRSTQLRGNLEMALSYVNEHIPWDDGERLLISFGQSRPYDPSDVGEPASWREEIRKLRSKHIAMFSVFVNLFQHSSESSADYARDVWRELGTHYCLDKYDLTEMVHHEIILKALAEFVNNYAIVRERFQFAEPMPWPLDDFYWKYLPRRGTVHEKS